MGRTKGQKLMLTCTQRRRMSQRSRKQQGQDGKWESNEKKKAAAAVLKKTVKLNCLVAKTVEQKEAEERIQRRRAKKYTAKLKDAKDNAALAILLPSLKRLKLSPKIFRSTCIGKALSDAKKRIQPSPTVLASAKGLLDRWRLSFRGDVSAAKVAAAEPSAAVRIAKQRQAELESKQKPPLTVPPSLGGALEVGRATDSLFRPAQASPPTASKGRQPPQRQAKLGVIRVKTRTEEDLQVKHTAQLLAFMTEEETRSQGAGGESRAAGATSFERKLAQRRSKQEASAAASAAVVQVDAGPAAKRLRRTKSSDSSSSSSSSSSSPDMRAPVIIIPAHEHQLRQTLRSRNTCDLCAKTGTTFRCGSGCDFDVCQECSESHGWGESGESPLPLADGPPSARPAVTETPPAKASSARAPVFSGRKQQKLAGFLGSGGSRVPSCKEEVG